MLYREIGRSRLLVVFSASAFVLRVHFQRVFQGLIGAVWMLLLSRCKAFVLGLFLIGSFGGHRCFCLFLGCCADR